LVELEYKEPIDGNTAYSCRNDERGLQLWTSISFLSVIYTQRLDEIREPWARKACPGLHLQYVSVCTETISFRHPNGGRRRSIVTPSSRLRKSCSNQHVRKNPSCVSQTGLSIRRQDGGFPLPGTPGRDFSLSILALGSV
jgi:hypothetical protein